MTGTAGWFFTFGEEVRRIELRLIIITAHVYQLYGICNPEAMVTGFIIRLRLY